MRFPFRRSWASRNYHSSSSWHRRGSRVQQRWTGAIQTGSHPPANSLNDDDGDTFTNGVGVCVGRGGNRAPCVRRYRSVAENVDGVVGGGFGRDDSRDVGLVVRRGVERRVIISPGVAAARFVVREIMSARCGDGTAGDDHGRDEKGFRGFGSRGSARGQQQRQRRRRPGGEEKNKEEEEDDDDGGVHGTIPAGGRGVAVGQYGQVFRSFAERDVTSFSELSGDWNPLHREWDVDELLAVTRRRTEETTAGAGAGADRSNPGRDDNSNVDGEDDLLAVRELLLGGDHDEENDGAERGDPHPLVRIREEQEEAIGDNAAVEGTVVAKKTEVLVHGMLVSSLFSRIFGTLVPGAVYLKQDLKFRKPVYANDVVLARVVVTRIRRFPSSGRGGEKRASTSSSGGIVVRCSTSAYLQRRPPSSSGGAGSDGAERDAQRHEELIECVTGEADVWLVDGTELSEEGETRGLQKKY